MSKVELTEQRYEQLLDCEAKLKALENGGVDNWQFYSDALESYLKEKEQKEKVNKLVDTSVDEICEIIFDNGIENYGDNLHPSFGLNEKALIRLKNCILNFIENIKDNDNDNT